MKLVEGILHLPHPRRMGSLTIQVITISRFLVVRGSHFVVISLSYISHYHVTAMGIPHVIFQTANH